jgi:hypothetical protein
VRAETALAGEGRVGLNGARFLILSTAQIWVDVSEVLGVVSARISPMGLKGTHLREVILSEARLHFLDTLADTQATHPRLGRIALLLVPLPIALSSVPLTTLPCALVNFGRIAPQLLRI